MPALLYQVAWQRLLTLYFGVDVYATTISVASFMLGLGVGSLVGGSVADRTRCPPFWYILAEFFTGLFGILSILFFIYR